MIKYTALNNSYQSQFHYFEMLEQIMIDKTVDLAEGADTSSSSYDSLWGMAHDVTAFCRNLLHVKGSHELRQSLAQQATQFMSSHIVYLDQIPAFSLTANQLEKNPVLVLHVSTHTPNTIALNLKPS